MIAEIPAWCEEPDEAGNGTWVMQNGLIRQQRIMRLALNRWLIVYRCRQIDEPWGAWWAEILVSGRRRSVAVQRRRMRVAIEDVLDAGRRWGLIA